LSNPQGRPVDKDLEDQLGGEEVGSGISRLRAELHDVRPYEPSSLTHKADQVKDLIPMETAGLRRADGRHLGGIEDIEVDGEIHVGPQVGEDLFLPGGSSPNVCGIKYGKVLLA
jgi:hypothetical protein